MRTIVLACITKEEVCMQKHEEIFYIEPERLVPFHNHPFRVTMDEDSKSDFKPSYGSRQGRISIFNDRQRRDP